MILLIGCIYPSDQCTSIHGKISATYSGTNEFGISNYIVNELRTGMETGAFVSEGSPALAIEFVTQTDMSAGENSGIVVPIQTDRGTIWQIMQEAADENPISKYGKLFVGLLVVLSVGFIISSVFKKRRRNKRKEALEAEVTDDHNAIQTEREEQISEENMPSKGVNSGNEEVDKAQSETGGWALFEKKKRTESPVLDQVELDVPKSDSDEVEISLSNEKKSGWW